MIYSTPTRCHTLLFFFSSRRRHTRFDCDWSSDVCSSDLESVDVLKKTLHRQWADEAEMRAGVDSLLGRVAEFSPLEPEEGETRAAAREGTEIGRASVGKECRSRWSPYH